MREVELAGNVRWSDWIGEGWQMFAARWGVWVVQTLIVVLSFAIPLSIFYIWIIASVMIAGQTGQPVEPEPIILVLFYVAIFLVLLASIYFWGGLWNTAMKQLHGEEIRVRDLFVYDAGSFLRILGATFLLAIFYFIGALLCIIPAFIVQGMLHFTMPLIIDRRMSVLDAIGASFNATKSHWIAYTLFALVIYMLGGMGAYVCLVGMLVTYPLQITIMTIAYRDTFGIQGALRFGPTSTATSYAGQSWPVSPAVASTDPPAPRPLFAQTVESRPSVTHCSSCGAEINRVAKFCNSCGAELQT
jgi:hypothetical protein